MNIKRLFNKLIICKDKLLDHGSHHELMSFQEMKGRFYAVYNDGKRSQNMSYSTANDYRQMFGGVVKHISE